MPARPDAAPLPRAPEREAGSAPAPADAVADPEGWRARATVPAALGAIRAELDRLDDAIHDLLMQRAEVVARMASQRLKTNGPAIRPGREAMILRRLLARHRGPLPRSAIVRLWRELFAATTAMQAPFSVAVCSPQVGSGFVMLAREQYGLSTPMRIVHSAPQVLAAVSAGEAQLGVLPSPADEDAEGWWSAMMNQDQPALRVIARLPFGPVREDAGAGQSAFVVAAIEPDPTEEDRSLIAFEVTGEASRARLAGALTAAGLPPRAFVQRRALPDDRTRLMLVEVDGFVTAGDARLAHFRAAISGAASITQLVPIGAYAVPLPAGGTGDGAQRPAPQSQG
ncbi:MAG: chorismate mutase [Alphaproteobacteria bacterium]|nr:chorismate mutase [Alphaproteobacteria bacterium]